MPTRKLSGPKPLNGSSQLSVDARFSAKAAILGERGATMPQPKIPTRRNRGPSPLRNPWIVPQPADGGSENRSGASGFYVLGGGRGRGTGDAPVPSGLMSSAVLAAAAAARGPVVV